MPKIEEVPADDASSTSSEDMPELEEAQEGGADGEAKGKQNRSEKKSRKAVLKLGLKPMTDVVRVTVRKSKNILFVIQKPDIFKSPASDTYIIFGEARIEDLSAQAQANAANQFAPARMPEVSSEPKSLPVAADDEEVDDTGCDDKDIELVVAQAGCTRAAAVAALKKNNNDIVEAIMELRS